ncbi:MAG: lysoplasmalogenase [Spirochaetaceae bacterium]|nr:lysoplasmalogenase [Spirochaetaceae bacterium]
MPFSVLSALIAAGFAAANLFCIIFFYQKPAQAFTKICIMPFLALYYALSDGVFLPAVFAAALFFWLGDILFAKRRSTPVIVCGIATFFAGNLCYSVSLSRFVSFSVGAFLCAVIITAAALVLIFASIPTARRFLAAATMFYALSLALLLLHAAALLVQRRDFASFLIFAGILCLTVSDISLARAYRSKANRLSNFLVMFLYSASQFCLLTGLSSL